MAIPDDSLNEIEWIDFLQDIRHRENREKSGLKSCQEDNRIFHNAG